MRKRGGDRKGEKERKSKYGGLSDREEEESTHGKEMREKVRDVDEEERERLMEKWSERWRVCGWREGMCVSVCL